MLTEPALSEPARSERVPAQPELSDRKATAAHFLDLVGRHAIDGLSELVTADWTMVGGPPNLPAGADGIRTLFATFGRISQHWRIDEIVGEGDVVVVRATCSVEQDEFFGVPAAGIQQVFAATFVHHFRGGLIAETYRTANDLGRLLQLGAVIRLPNDWPADSSRGAGRMTVSRPPDRSSSC